MAEKNIKSLGLGIIIGVLGLGLFISGGVAERVLGIGLIDKVLGKIENKMGLESGVKREVLDEENVVTKVADEAGPSVVTVSISKTKVTASDPFFGFDPFGGFFSSPGQTSQEQIEQDIGTGFIISKDGLIVTNKHVVSDVGATYRVVIGKDQVEEVVNIYRDPINDLAILKVNRNDLRPISLGSSDQLKVGQTVIAIGTALGEFRSTVTKGVISGLGRGIVAGSPIEGSEKLDNVIQTDAAINPGNSGGPLLNSSGEVIGVNVAVSAQGQNIGFAIPINVVKESIANFSQTGEFERPYIGVAYRMISKQAALLNEVPVGAYVSEVATDSPADKAGIKVGDIITEIDGNKLDDEEGKTLVSLINKKKIGDEVKVRYWRGKEFTEVKVKLEKR